MRRLVWLLLLPAVLSCAYASIQREPGLPKAEPDPSAQVVVLVPVDAAFGGKVYPGTGRFVAEHTLAALRHRFPLAQLLDEHDEHAALARARQDSIAFLISPVILHWEDRATNWSGMRDKVQIELRLLRVEPPELVQSVLFEARNNSFTLFDDKPEVLLDEDFDNAVLALVVEPQ